MSVKQVIVMRKDLNMRKGKMVAQGAHASMKVMMEKLQYSPETFYERTMSLTEEEIQWVDGIFTKICLSCDSEPELLELYKKAKDAGLNCALITDNGLTEFNGVPTNTCIAIGPNASEKIDAITGGLKLL